MTELHIYFILVTPVIAWSFGLLNGYLLWGRRRKGRRVPKIAGTTTLTVSPIANIGEGDFLRVERVER